MTNTERVAAENETRARLEADVFTWARELGIPRLNPPDGFGPRTARALVQVMGTELAALREEVARLRKVVED